MRKVEKFGLRGTMTNDEIVAELHGRVSGETAEEIAPFFSKPLAGLEWRDAQQAERLVLEEDGEHALLARFSRTLDPILGKFPVDKVEYWLSGVTDEGTYFLHPITQRPVTRSGLVAPTLDAIVAWVNRTDQGFSGRVQGDMLIKFEAHPVQTFGGETVRARPRWTPELQNPPQDPRASSGRVQTAWTWDSTNWQTRGYTLEGTGSGDRLSLNPADRNLQPSKSVRLGNHRLSTDGWCFVDQQSGFVVVDGDDLILQHPEHARVERKIPKGHYAVVAPQRGRAITVTGDGQGTWVRGAD